MARMMPETTDMLTWAKWWVQQGWSVFPLGVREKEPATQNGFKDATQDIEQIELWWGRTPDANIGGVPPEGKFAVDIDGPTDIEFPPTWEHRTANGRHLVYEQHPLNLVPHGQKIWPHVDTRCHGKGYVVLPPSVHPSGKRYELLGVRSIEVFPSTIKAPVKPKRGRPGVPNKPKSEESVIEALRFEGVDGTGRDDTMIRIAGYLARYVPDEDVYAQLLYAINRGWVDPLDESALGKKFLLFKRHQEVVAEKTAKALDDESRGWLFERSEPDHGYDTPIEGRDGTVTFMPITDFTMQATGVIVAPGFTKRTYIVDVIKSDGTKLTGEKIDSDTLVDGQRLKKWLGRRALSTFDHRKDPRGGTLGQRLLKLLEGQEPITLESRDHYGWCKTTQAFLIEQGEVTADGLRGFTNVYPDDRLRTDAPTAFRFDADSAQAREWLSRVLALQPEREAAKVGAWAMMLLLRGQWDGLMPGLLVQASAGTGKTRFFQLLFKLLGSTNEGEALTVPAMRDKLLGNTSGAVWLDDVHLDDRQQQLMRGALTNGKVTLKTQDDGGAWATTEKHMRASIVVSGEGVEWYRQKALRDRFIEIEFDKSVRTTDADKLVSEDIGAASGALLMLVLSTASRLPELETYRTGIKARDEHARATLRMGAEILDAVLGTGAKWATIIGEWDRTAAKETLGDASENILYMLPTIWTRLGHPREAGVGNQTNPVWYDEFTKTFWVHAQQCADYIIAKMRIDDRQRQLCSQAGITRELDACNAGESKSKRTRSIGGTSKPLKYRQLPMEYSDMILQRADMLDIEGDE